MPFLRSFVFNNLYLLTQQEHLMEQTQLMMVILMIMLHFLQQAMSIQ